MRSSSIYVAACILLALLAVASASDAQATLAALRGKVTDDQGAVLPGVTITARHVATNTVRTGVSSEVGQYYLPNLPAGEYEVTSELSGFAAARREGVVLQVGQEISLDFRL
jgi:hypothetical protein